MDRWQREREMKTHEICLKNGQLARIRPLEVEDAEAVLDYINRVTAETDFLALESGELDWPIEKEREFIESHRVADNKLVIAAEVGNHIVGLSGFTGDDKKKMRHSGELGITVRREFWGLGLGSALMACVIDWAKSSGVVRKIGLRVRTDNVRAIRLYERFGFVGEGTISRQFLVAGRFRDAYLMGLEVNPSDDPGAVTGKDHDD
jgi:RimJ/RimL family protein N-acetyltransferase